MIAERTGSGGPSDPPGHFDEAKRAAWCAILAAAPPVVRRTDARFLELVAERLADHWRCPHGPAVRELYRDLGQFFVPMRERRRLLFPRRLPAPRHQH